MRSDNSSDTHPADPKPPSACIRCLTCDELCRATGPHFEQLRHHISKRHFPDYHRMYVCSNPQCAATTGDSYFTKLKRCPWCQSANARFTAVGESKPMIEASLAMLVSHCILADQGRKESVTRHMTNIIRHYMRETAERRDGCGDVKPTLRQLAVSPPAESAPPHDGATNRKNDRDATTADTPTRDSGSPVHCALCGFAAPRRRKAWKLHALSHVDDDACDDDGATTRQCFGLLCTLPRRDAEGDGERCATHWRTTTERLVRCAGRTAWKLHALSHVDDDACDDDGAMTRQCFGLLCTLLRCDAEGDGERCATHWRTIMELREHCMREHVDFDSRRCAKCAFTYKLVDDFHAHVKAQHAGRAKSTALQLHARQLDRMVEVWQFLVNNGDAELKVELVKLQAKLHALTAMDES